MNSVIRALVIAALLLCSAIPLADPVAVLTGHVIKVVDGDTIDVQVQSGPIRKADTA